jgi:hypothetical protein
LTTGSPPSPRPPHWPGVAPGHRVADHEPPDTPAPLPCRLHPEFAGSPPLATRDHGPWPMVDGSQSGPTHGLSIRSRTWKRHHARQYRSRPHWPRPLASARGVGVKAVRLPAIACPTPSMTRPLQPLSLSGPHHGSRPFDCPPANELLPHRLIQIATRFRLKPFQSTIENSSFPSDPATSC